MEDFFLDDVADGMYYHCAKIYKYLPDNICNRFQKFSKVLRNIYVYNLTGITDEAKVKIAVTLFNGETPKMDNIFKKYEFPRE